MIKEFKLVFKNYEEFNKFKQEIFNINHEKIIKLEFFSIEHIPFKQKELILDDISGEVEINFQTTFNYNDFIQIIPKDIIEIKIY